MNGTEREAGRRAPRRWWGWAAAALSFAAGAVLGLALPAGGSPTPEVVDLKDVRLPDPVEALQRAEAAVPYPVRLPRTLPAGAKLALVVWDTPETVEEPGRWDVGASYWLTAGGELRGKLSILQTNAPGAGAWVDDFEPIELVTIAGQEWKLARIPASQLGVEFLQLSTTFPDGVTFFMAAPAKLVPLEVLTEVAASVAPTEPPVRG